MKLEKKQEKALKELQEVKAIEAKQEEVKALFVTFDTSEEIVADLYRAIDTSEEVVTARANFRKATLALLEALETKVFASREEVKVVLGFDKNKISRLVKCAKVFRKLSKEQLEATLDKKGKPLNELVVKAMSHSDGKALTDLIADEDATAEDLANAKDKKDSQGQTPSKKFTKAVSNMVELLGDSNLTEEERFLGFMQIKASAGLNLKAQMEAQIKKEVKAYQDIVTGNKAKVKA
jgi:hypothetical protein